MRRAVAMLLVCACIVAGVAGKLEDGLPRPVNFADEPTTWYGPEPMLTDARGAPVDCDWYGFSNSLYAESVTAACQETLRTALTNETSNPVSQLRPYVYYTLMSLIDTATNESYCYQGCFELDLATPPVSAPVSAPGPYFRGPALAPEYAPGPVLAPSYYYDGPSMAPVSEPPYESPDSAPAMSPGN